MPASKLCALYLVSAASIILTFFFVKNPSPPQANFSFFSYSFILFGAFRSSFFFSLFSIRVC